MKKNIVPMILALALCAPSAFANPPKIGDYVKYQTTTVHKSGPDDVVTLAYTLISFDSVKNRFNRSIEGVDLAGSEPGQTLNDQDTYKPAIMPNGGDYVGVLDGCEKTGGKIVDITAAGQNLKSCYYGPQDSQTWMANVPFGIVKGVTVDSSNGDVTTQELIEYRFGQ